MEHIIIGTAGHIDHGKTALIRALTGRETDTQKEEKERGITIDLGFTWFDLPGGKRAGVIDVPGHEKFLPNMLAGVCGMDFALLVIAADEGIMPQTIEHMDILSELSVSQGFIVLTKIDMVDEGYEELVAEDIKEQLKGTVFADWPIYSVDSLSLKGIKELKEALAKKADSINRIRDDKGSFRMPIDRVLSLKGLGTVVAGTVLEGSLHVDQEIRLYPSERVAKVKSIQSHGENEDACFPGQRAAILLSGVDKKEAHRGMVAASLDSLYVSNRFDVFIHLNNHTERTLKHQQRVHLHMGTEEVTARVVLFSKDLLEAGDSDYAQLITDKEITAKRKDRFVIRFLSPLETIGGGQIINVKAVKRKRNNEEVIKYLENALNDQKGDLIKKLLSDQSRPVAHSKLFKLTELSMEDFQDEIDELLSEKTIFSVNGRKEPFYWTIDKEADCFFKVDGYFKERLKESPFCLGDKKVVIRAKLFRDYEPLLFDAYMESLESRGMIRLDGEIVIYGDPEERQNEEYEKLLSDLSKKLNSAGMDFIDINSEKPSDMTNEAYEDFILAAIYGGSLVRVHDEFVTTREVAAKAVKAVEEFFLKEDVISVATLRDLLGTSRRSAKPFMAYLDEIGVTVWCGKETERKRKEEN